MAQLKKICYLSKGRNIYFNYKITTSPSPLPPWCWQGNWGFPPAHHSVESHGTPSACKGRKRFDLKQLKAFWSCRRNHRYKTWCLFLPIKGKILQVSRNRCSTYENQECPHFLKQAFCSFCAAFITCFVLLFISYTQNNPLINW